jgi:carbamoyl-phosphate synthase large subunit
MREIGLACPRSRIAHSIEEALATQAEIGFPTVIRPSFTLGGTGGGIAYNREEFEEIVARGLDASPTSEVLLEEAVIGWKEFEMEVVRDRNDNCIIICSIENVDPMGIHTGDSITVAPAQTLTDKEYQLMREASIAVLRKIGVECGGSNVQFAVNPLDGRLLVIEMNPRVSRSSALASKRPASRSRRSRRNSPWATRSTSSGTRSPAARPRRPSSPRSTTWSRRSRASRSRSSRMRTTGSRPR